MGALDFDALNEMAKFFDEKNGVKMLRIYKKAAPEIIRLNERPYDILIEERLDRLKRIEDNWNDIVKVISEAPKSQEIKHF